jgi:hypothetical protein
MVKVARPNHVRAEEIDRQSTKLSTEASFQRQELAPRDELFP